MKKPFNYTVICDITGEVIQETNTAPLLHHLQKYVPTDEPDIKVLKQVRTVYVDTRYQAKLRLYNYITFTKQGLIVPKFNPFKSMNKNTPILNF